VWRLFEEGVGLLLWIKGLPGHLVIQSLLSVCTEPPGNAFQPSHSRVHCSPTQGLGLI
jgi:hypothetical protein